MATDRELILALRKAAEDLVRRRITDQEADALLKHFNESQGTHYERARLALARFANISTLQINERAAASDNTDRILKELDTVTKNWKPGS